MKKTNIYISLLCILFFVSIGCESNNELNRLKAENKKLKEEIEEVKYSPEKLLILARNQHKQKNYVEAKKNIKLLTEKYPSSAETKEANKLLIAINDTLNKNKASKEEAEEKKLAIALKKMSKKRDLIEGITWYQDISSPVHQNTDGFFLYFGINEEMDNAPKSKPFLRFSVQYHANNWLFVESYKVKADDKIFDRSCHFERDNYTTIWEWCDSHPTAADINMIKAVISSKKATIRFIGKQYHNDKPITASQKKALQNVLDAYKALGGELL